MPKSPNWHLAPGIAQFLFYAISFLLPFESKMRWVEMASPALGRVTGVGVVVGLFFYGFASFRLLRDYRLALAAARSDDL